MSIVYREQSLQLSLESEDSKALGSLALDMFLDDSIGSSAEYPSLKDFILVEAGFYVRENIFTAVLSMAGDGNLGEGTLLPGLFQADSSAILEGFPANSVEIELSYPLNGEISCGLGSSREQASTLPVRESRGFGAGQSADERVSAAEPAISAAEELVPARAPGLLSAETPADQGSSQTESYPSIQ
jgi:hypothetical protein